MSVPSTSEQPSDPVQTAAGASLPAPSSADLPPATAAPATRSQRAAALLLDALFVLLLLWPALLTAPKFLARSMFGVQLSVSSLTTSLLSLIPALFVLAQWGLVARTGQSVGQRIAGIASLRADRAPGFARGLFLALAPPVWGLGLALLLTVKLTRLPLWIGPAGLVAALLVIPLKRALGVRDVMRGGEEARAFEPPRFSSSGFIATILGLLLSGALAAGLAVLVERLSIESTDYDVPTLVAAAALPLGLIVTGLVASFAARRFLVGELALTALLVGLLAFELMSVGLVPVPALQRFEIASWLDWSVYAIALYFGANVFLIIGSALGFMVTSDEGLDVSTRFERLVARRHLRLQLSHWVMLALIATLAPILVYGVLIWPVRATWRLMRGHRGPKPLPPTVFMALLTIVGVMFGVTSLTVVLGVMGGFERDLKEKILGTNAHGVVHRYVGDFTEWRDVQRKIAQVPGVEGVTPFILSEVMITTDNSVTGSVLKGIDVETVGQVTDLAKYIGAENGRLSDLLYPDRIPHKGEQQEEGAAEGEEQQGGVLPGIVIGREMARQLNVWIGDKVTVMNPLGELGPQGPIPRSRVFRVAAIFVSGMYEYDSKFAYIQLKEAQRFFRMGDSVSGIELRFHNVDEARPLMRKIIALLDNFPYKGKDWGEMNQNLFSALRLERVVMFILLSFQVLIACICVIATLVMLVVEKRKEVATLKAMGAREGSIMKLFVIEGLIIGAIGTFYGSAAGLLFCKLIEKFGVNLDPQVYYITRLPVVIEPTAFISVALVAMVLVFVATIYPARRGGSIAPVEGFREE